MSLSVCIPTLRRAAFLRESIPKYLESPFVTEVILTDETGEDVRDLSAWASHPKLRMYTNERRLGALANKQRAASYATSDYICIIDSDNYAPPQYFEAFQRYIATQSPSESTLLLPSRARPSFDFTEYIGIPLTKATVHRYWPKIEICLNTMNMIIRRSFWQKYTILSDTPWCVDADGSYDALYFTFYSLFQMNATLAVVPGMEYDHRVHGGSWYMESLERSKDIYGRLLARYFPPGRTDPISEMTLREWQMTYKDPSTLIVQASSMTMDDSWTPFPIGMQHSYATVASKSRDLQIGLHDRLVFCGLSPSTDEVRRPTGINRRSILATLAANGISNTPSSSYFYQLPFYKFVISPEGNGIDCHRHYEALLAGCIPIVEHNPKIEAKYAGCPILYTTDYSEITPEYLTHVYEEMKDRVYSFRALCLSSYSSAEQDYLKACGNFWMTRLTGKPWYTLQPSLSICSMGGLGNQLFQLAALHSGARKFNRIPILVDVSNPSPHTHEDYFATIFQTWKARYQPVASIPTFQETSRTYYNWASQIEGYNPVRLLGYFQDYRYIEPDFVSTLTLPKEVLSRYPEISSWVFLHLRGGDYIGNTFLDINLDAYYESAVAMFPGAHFALFTNDRAFALSRPWIAGLSHTFIDESECETLVLMSRCRGGICGNSTFSWWGGYLNPARPIVIPSKWFLDPSVPTDGYRVPGWTVCPVRQRIPAYCIHLAHRTDRKAHMNALAAAYPCMDIRYVDAISHSNGAIGGNLSHKKVIAEAKLRGDPYVLVLEDDCTMLVSSEELEGYIEDILMYIRGHPEIQIVNGCGNLTDHRVTSTTSFRSLHFLTAPTVYTAHWILYCASSYDTLLASSTEVAADVVTNECTMVFTYPYLATQIPSYSDIQRTDVSYENIEASRAFVKNLLEPPRPKQNVHQGINLRPVFRIPIRTKRV